MADDERSLWGYRAHLDGLRAVAVYLVVAFHAGMGRLVGGFIGVDVFFVLSGYLVTTVLLRDLHGEGGRIRFGRFYARRARRLLPAAAVALVVTAVVFSSLGTTSELLDARSAIRAAALYVANWHFIHQASDYFAADIDASPVVHFWSLSVEEQFYLLWPLLLGGLFAAARRFGRRRDAVVRGVVVVLGLVSVGAALHLAGSNLNRAYYGTDTRAYQLLAGAALALTPALPRLLGRRLPSWLLGFGSAALVLATFVDFTDGTIPDEVSLPGIPIGIACSVLFMLYPRSGLSVMGPFELPVVNSLVGALVGGVILFALDKGALLLLKKPGMGFGDVKLIAMLGAFFGLYGAVLIIIIASFIGSFVGIVLILAGKLQKVPAPGDEKTEKGKTDKPVLGHYLPFGPYLALAGVVVMLAGSAIIDFYFNTLIAQPTL